MFVQINDVTYNTRYVGTVYQVGFMDPEELVACGEYLREFADGHVDGVPLLRGKDIDIISRRPDVSDVGYSDGVYESAWTRPEKSQVIIVKFLNLLHKTFFQYPVDHSGEGFQFDGFEQEIPGAYVEGFEGIAVVGGGENDIGRLSLQVFSKLYARQAWHIDVKEYQVDGVVLVKFAKGMNGFGECFQDVEVGELPDVVGEDVNG